MKINHSLLARLLYCLGCPKGNKTKQEFLIPEWIIADNSYQRMFLRGILEDELSTIKIEKKSYSSKPQFKRSKQEELIESLRSFLKQIKECIESFGVQCSEVSQKARRKGDQKTKDLYFYIMRNKSNIIQFQKEIGFFLNNKKIANLDECCQILKATLPPNIGPELVLNLREQMMSMRQIAARVGCSKTTVYRMVHYITVIFK